MTSTGGADRGAGSRAGRAGRAPGTAGAGRGPRAVGDDLDEALTIANEGRRPAAAAAPEPSEQEPLLRDWFAPEPADDAPRPPAAREPGGSAGRRGGRGGRGDQGGGGRGNAAGTGRVAGTGPGTDPGAQRGKGPGAHPGKGPGTDAVTGPNPGTDAGTGPGTDPGAGPDAAPGTGPGVNPGPDAARSTHPAPGKDAGTGGDEPPARPRHGAMPWSEARTVAARAARGPLSAHARELGDALGQILAEPLTALTDLPSFDSSAMDGWAVSGPGPWRLAGEGGPGILAGHTGPAIEDGQAVPIATGAPVPAGTTAVLRSEHGDVHHVGHHATSHHATSHHATGQAHAGQGHPRQHRTAQHHPARHHAEQGRTEQGNVERGNAEQGSTEQDSAERARSGQHHAQQPTAQQPTAQQPTAQQPTAQQPTAQPPSAQPPSAPRPTTQQSGQQPRTDADRPSHDRLHDRLHARHSLTPGQDIRPRGQECRSGDRLLAAGTRVTPAVLGLAAAAGYDTLRTVRRPRVEILILGDELLDSGPPRDGLVRDALGPMLAPWLRALGAEVTGPHRLGDDAGLLRRAVTTSTADLLVTTGGTAAGPVDHVHPVLRSTGAELLVDGVAVRPGHPMLLARTASGRLLVGLPGNPLAAVSGLLTLVEPLLRTLSGRAPCVPAQAALAEGVTGHPRSTRLVPVVYRADASGTSRNSTNRNSTSPNSPSRNSTIPNAAAPDTISPDAIAPNATSPARTGPHGTTPDGGERAVPLRFNGPAMLRGVAAADGFAVVPPGGAEPGAVVEILELPWFEGEIE